MLTKAKELTNVQTSSEIPKSLDISVIRKNKRLTMQLNIDSILNRALDKCKQVFMEFKSYLMYRCNADLVGLNVNGQRQFEIVYNPNEQIEIDANSLDLENLWIEKMRSRLINAELNKLVLLEFELESLIKGMKDDQFESKKCVENFVQSVKESYNFFLPHNEYFYYDFLERPKRLILCGHTNLCKLFQNRVVTPKIEQLKKNISELAFEKIKNDYTTNGLIKKEKCEKINKFDNEKNLKSIFVTSKDYFKVYTVLTKLDVSHLNELSAHLKMTFKSGNTRIETDIKHEQVIVHYSPPIQKDSLFNFIINTYMTRYIYRNHNFINEAQFLKYNNEIKKHIDPKNVYTRLFNENKDLYLVGLKNDVNRVLGMILDNSSCKSFSGMIETSTKGYENFRGKHKLEDMQHEQVSKKFKAEPNSFYIKSEPQVPQSPEKNSSDHLADNNRKEEIKIEKLDRSAQETCDVICFTQLKAYETKLLKKLNVILLVESILKDISAFMNESGSELFLSSDNQTSLDTATKIICDNLNRIINVELKYEKLDEVIRNFKENEQLFESKFEENMLNCAVEVKSHKKILIHGLTQFDLDECRKILVKNI